MYAGDEYDDDQTEQKPAPHVVIRQCPGWWPALVHAVCEDCGWTGPTRDQNQTTGRRFIRYDKAEHRCE